MLSKTQEKSITCSEQWDIPIHGYQIADMDFVVCDVETTGLSPERNRLTEIALIKIRSGEIVDSYSSLINPRQFITSEITRITGISNEMVYTAPEAVAVLPEVKRFIHDAIFVAHNARFDRAFIDASLNRIGATPLKNPMLCTARLARRLLPKKSKASLGVLAAQYGIRITQRHRARGDAEATARLLLIFLQTLEEEFDITEVGDLLSFQNRQIYRIVGAPKYYSRIVEQLISLPHAAGVYFFHGKKGEVLYIGKARDLKQRVSSYFYHNIGHTEKIRRLLRTTHSLSWQQTETELSALLQESRLIKQYQPDYNYQLKRFRRYPFLRINIQDEWPGVDWCYDINDDGAEYFGPFRSRFAAEETLDCINKLFGLRECVGAIRPDPAGSPCLYYDLKRCIAPCAAMVSREVYMQEVKDVIRFMQGGYDSVLYRFRARMEEKSEALDFEAAAVLRDRIKAVERVVMQQKLMLHSVRKRNLIIVTPAQGRNLEVHFIRSGMLAAQFVLDQQAVNKKNLMTAIKTIFRDEHSELLGSRLEDVDEMRIIASWCLTRRDESAVIDTDAYPDTDGLLEVLCRTIRFNTWEQTPLRRL